MTTGNEVKIFRALTDRLDAFATAQSLTIAKPGLDFTPPASGAYLKAWFLPASTGTLSIDDGGSNEHPGVFQVSVFYPIGAGIVPAFELASLVAAYFKRGTRVSHGGLSFEIKAAPSIGPAIDEPGWTHVPVSIPFRHFLSNA